MTIFKWMNNCSTFTNDFGTIGLDQSSNPFELANGSKMILDLCYSRAGGQWNLYLSPITLKDNKFVELDVKVWLEATGEKKITDLYVGNMLHGVAGCLGDPISNIRSYNFKLFRENECPNGIIFCCEIKLKDGEGTMKSKALPADIEFRKNLWSIYNEGLHRNAVTLKLDGKDFKISQDVLTSQSEVFKNMFNLNTIESQSGTVNLNVSVKVMEVFVKWLYLGKCEDLESVATELFVFADKYAFLELKCRCLKYLREELTLSTVSSRLILAFIYEDEKLKQKCLKFVRGCSRSEYVPILLASEDWIKLNNSDSELASKVMLAIISKK